MTRSEAAKLTGLLLAAYPNSKFTAQTIELYEQSFLDLDFHEAKAAVESVVRSSKWVPTIAEVRSAMVDLSQGPTRLGGEAWGDVVGAFPAFRTTERVPVFKDALTGRCVDLMGGWHALWQSNNETADRARFIDLYTQLAERERKHETMGLQLPAPPAGFRLLPKGKFKPVPERGLATVGQLLAKVGEK